jgi:hypothetical protein
MLSLLLWLITYIYMYKKFYIIFVKYIYICIFSQRMLPTTPRPNPTLKMNTFFLF